VTSINILIDTIKRENYTMTTFYTDFQTSDIFENLKMSDFRSTLLNFRYLMPQSRFSKKNCTDKEIVFYAIPGQVSETVGRPNNSEIASFNFTKTLYHQNMESIGIN
jgi:hypothetical protein